MIAYFDMFSGISGDMVLGAFVDLGVPVAWLKEQFNKMPLPDANIKAEDIWHNGIKAVNLFVEDTHHHFNQAHVGHKHPDKNHFDHPEHNHPSHDHSDHKHSSHDHAKTHRHTHSRNYLQIQELICNSPFSAYVKASSLEAFEKIAIAESAIHGTPIEAVHFHEVGGVDAIVDITGAFLCVEYLGITKIYGSVPSLGTGSVTCCHGVIPVPAPATLKILKGVPVRASDSDMETITPTGAAIITTMTRQFGDIPNMVMGNTGYGSGKRKSVSGLPNVLRIITGKDLCTWEENTLYAVYACKFSNPNILRESVYVLETAIDDMNPEIAGYIMEKLFEKGALDVSYTPLQMKKNRPAFRLEVICRKDLLEIMIELVLTETTSSGLRFYKMNRAVLARKNVEIDTPFGKVKAKQITDPTGKARIVPEYDVCRKIALEKNIPIKDVYFLIDNQKT